MKKIIIILLLLPCWANAQVKISNFTVTIPDVKQYSNSVYKPYIQTVMLYDRAKQNSLPVITLNGFDQLLLCFDDLTGGIKNYFFSVELCDAKWNPSNLPPMSYLADFTQSRISNYRFSFNTKQKYTYYEATFPNSDIRPTKSGNYLLKVFEDGDETKLILTRRFYVQENLAGIGWINTPATYSDFQQKQQVNFLVDTRGLNISDPFSQTSTVVMQNARPDNQQSPQAPPFINNARLKYNGLEDNIFWGGNEFRYFDISSLRLAGWNVKNINAGDSVNSVVLSTDKPLANQPYIQRLDHDGHFYITNEDGTDSRKDADYVIVKFSLQSPALSAGNTIYIIGQFNNWAIHPNHKLIYNTAKNIYEATLYLKQGLYDYCYVVANDSGAIVSDVQIDGSFAQTENNYQIFFYYRSFGDLYDRLTGFYKFNWLNRQ